MTTEFAVVLSGIVTPMAATMNSHAAMPRAPMIRRGLRPHFSTKYKPGKTPTMLHTSQMTVTRKGFEIPVRWK